LPTPSFLLILFLLSLPPLSLSLYSLPPPPPPFSLSIFSLTQSPLASLPSLSLFLPFFLSSLSLSLLVLVNVQAVEILTALKKLGEELSREEEALLANNMSQQMADFEAASSELAGGGILSQVLLVLPRARSRFSFSLSFSFSPSLLHTHKQLPLSRTLSHMNSQKPQAAKQVKAAQ